VVLFGQRSHGWAEETIASLKAAFVDFLNLTVLDVSVTAVGRRAMVRYPHPEFVNKAIEILDMEIVNAFPGVP
jgi:hypothetical protein